MKKQIDGELIDMTAEEEAAFVALQAQAALLEPDATAIEEARKESLYDACIKWQSRPADPHTCDSNFFAMLTSIKTLSRITGLPVATKAAACLAWLDTLWGDYYARKANGSTDYDFSAHGGCPHSFLEVREEAGE